jgi:hypothetical protein
MLKQLFKSFSNRPLSWLITHIDIFQKNIDLPSHSTCTNAVNKENATKTEYFIYNHQPARGDGSREFREDLQALIVETVLITRDHYMPAIITDFRNLDNNRYYLTLWDLPNESQKFIPMSGKQIKVGEVPIIACIEIPNELRNFKK